MKRHLSRVLPVVLYLLCVAPAARAATFQVFLDLDGVTTGGCTGPVGGSGFEQRLTTTVDEGSLTVTAVTFANCAAGVYGGESAVSPITPPWPVGPLGSGTNNSHVIETYLAASDLAIADPTTARILAAGTENPQAGPFDTVAELVLVLASVVEIPTLGGIELIVLAALLLAAGFLVLRRGGAVALVIAVLLAGATATWALVLLDGDPSDWAGTTPVLDPAGDGSAGADIQAFFAREDVCGPTQVPCLAFRFDSTLLLNAPPVANDDVANVAEDPPGAVQIDVLANDTDFEGDSFTVASVSDPANGTAAVTNGGADVSYLPDLNFCGSDTFTYTLTPGGDTATVTVTVTCANDPPTITSSATPSVPEGQTSVIDVQSTDPDGETEGAGLTYSITGGADQALFTIAPATGLLSFIAPSDFEAPTDAGANNVYDVQVTVTDGAPTTDVQDIAVTVTNLTPEPPAITTPATANVPENQTAVIDVQSTDPDGDTEGAGLTYTLTGGADVALFSIVPATGVLTFNSAPDFEAPADSGANNVYDVQVTVTDSDTQSTLQNLQVTVTDVDEDPTITSAAAVSVPENQTAVIDVQATDPEGDTEGAGLTYSITGGADAADFSIVAATGVLTFNSAPDFEAPGDTGGDNVYDVQVTVTDSGTNTDVQNLQVTVTDTTEPPTITSSATPSVPENTTAAIDVQSTDPDGDTEGAGLTYSLTGGADVALFSIVPATGVLTFNSAPNFEAPADSGANNVYDVQVTVTDSGAQTAVQNLQVTITNINEAPSITSSATPSVPENQTAAIDVQSTDPEGDTEGSGLTYSLTGGADVALFSIVPATGVLTFNSAPDFENPGDAGANNVYDVQVTVTDSGLNTDVQNLQVTVTNTTEPPSITSSATPSAPENQTAVIDVQSTDPDGDTEGAGLTYGITGGADAALFSIVPATGVLTFNSAPNFEAPADAGVNNVYDVQVTVTDSGAQTDVQNLQVTVTNVNEAPVITSSATPSVPENQTAVIDVSATDPEGDTEGAGLTYSITGGADVALFSIVPATGVLTFNSAPNFESPSDAGANNVYDVQVTVTDSGAQTGLQNLQVTVTDAAEPPSITSSATPSAPENQTGVIDVQSTDPDGDTEGAGLTYSLTGGADAALFSIVPATGVLTFNSAPNFEAPTDAGANNVYDVQVTVTDSDTQTAVQNLQVTVTNVNESPTITSSATPSVNENTTAVIDVQSTDPDGTVEGAGGLTYAITGGADAALFSIVSTTGVLTFNSAPNFEAPGDAGADNVYDVQVTVTDPGTLTGVQNLQVTVLNVPEPPITNPESYDTIGNTLLQVAATETETGPHVFVTGNVLANDVNPELPPMTASFVSATGGATVNLASDGTFTYVPGPGSTGAQTFIYNATNASGSTAGTVTINIQQMVWYVKNDGAAGNGTSVSPFNSIVAANLADDGGDGDLTDDVDANGHWIFVHFGDGTSTNMSTGLRLEHQQHLIGEHAGLSIPVSLNGGPNPTVVLAPVAGNRPLLDDTVAGGPEGIGATPIAGVDVIPTEIVGMNLAGNVNAIDWSTASTGTGTFAILDNVIRSAGADGVDINLAGTAATTLAFSQNNLTATGTGLDIQETGAGALTIISFQDNVVNGNTGGSGLVVNNAIFDATPGVPFNTVIGGNTVIGALGNGVGGAGMVLTGIFGDLAFTDLDIFADNGAGFQLAGNGAVNVGTGNGTRVTVGAGVGIFQATGGPAVSVNNATIDLQLTSLQSTNSPTTGVSLVSAVDGTSAAIFSAGSGSSISNITAGAGTAFLVTTSNADVDYAGTISTNTGSGVSLTNNGGGTIDFTGAITVSTGTNPAFVATGGGAVTATATTSTLTTASGTPVNISGGTTIGAAGVTFRSVAANGSVNGIILNGSGTNFFLVRGDNTLARNGSGGTINNTSGDAIQLTNASNVTLQSMNLTSNGSNPATAADAAGTGGNHTVQVSGGSNVVLSGVHIDGSDGSGFVALNLGGTNRINNDSRFENTLAGAGHGIYVNNTNTNMTLFELNNMQMVDNAATHTNLFFANTGTSNMTLQVQNNCLFEDLGTQALTVAAGGTAATTGTLTSLIDNNDFQNAKGVGENNVGILVINGANHVATVSNNLFSNIAKDGTIANTSILRTQNSGGDMTATITGNTIQNIAYGVGSGGRHAIGHVFEPVAYNAGDSSTLFITNNIVSNVTFPSLGNNREAVFIDYRTTASNGEVTIQGNNFNMPTAGAQQAMELRFRQTNNSTVNVLVRGNTVAHNTVANFLDVDTEDSASAQVTVDGNNNFTNANGTPGTTVAMASEDPAAAGGPPTMCVNINGNTLQSGAGTISLDETAGTMTVTQASTAAMAAANGIPAGNVTSSGTPTFNSAACTLP